MKIKYLGHSSFLLTESTGVTVLTDPFDPSVVGYDFAPPDVDIITVSHDHSDHNYVKAVNKYSELFSEPGKYEHKGIHIIGEHSFHDDEEGSKRGKNTVFKFRMDGVNICHLGDIGEECSPELIERLLPVNVLLIPVGGNYTIDAEQAKEYVDRLMPDIVIPMHYKERHCEIDIDKVDPFLRLFEDEYVQEDVKELDLDRNDFNESIKSTKIIVMDKD